MESPAGIVRDGARLNESPGVSDPARESTGIVSSAPLSESPCLIRSGSSIVRVSNGESVEWRFEALPVPIMVKNGWTEDSLSVGDEVAAEGYAARQAPSYAWLHRLIKEDGTILNPGQTGSPGATEGEVAN